MKAPRDGFIHRRQHLDVTLAYKAIGLSWELSGTDKRVAAVIVAHFNLKTGRCDPGLTRIALLSGVSRRTAIRAVKRLRSLGMLVRDRHGGHFNRNHYQPRWESFRDIEAKWKKRMEAVSAQLRGQEMSPAQGRVCHLDGDLPVTQTLQNNNLNITSRCGPSQQHVEVTSGRENSKELSKKNSGLPNKGTQMSNSRSMQAAYADAERRWNASLMIKYHGTPEIYSAIVQAIDAGMQEKATEAELQRRGTGDWYIIDQLRARIPSLMGSDRNRPPTSEGS